MKFFIDTANVDVSPKPVVNFIGLFPAWLYTRIKHMESPLTKIRQNTLTACPAG